MGATSVSLSDGTAWHFCSAQGYRAVMCRGWRAAWAEITGYLEMRPTRVWD